MSYSSVNTYKKKEINIKKGVLMLHCKQEKGVMVKTLSFGGETGGGEGGVRVCTLWWGVCFMYVCNVCVYVETSES